MTNRFYTTQERFAGINAHGLIAIVVLLISACTAIPNQPGEMKPGSEQTQPTEKGEQGTAMYIIVDGKAKVHDEDHLFSYLSGGDCFGEYTLIDEKQRSASVTIMEKTTLFRLSIDIFQELIAKNSVFVQGVLQVLVDRLRNLDKVQTQLSISNQQLKEQSQKIAEKNQELKYFNLTRTRVLSIVAEDLNSPIQEILEIIDNPASADNIDAIKDRLVKMEDIIKQLLNLKTWGTESTD